MKLKISDHLRIISAIIRKDMVDGIKNKNVLAVLLTSIFMIMVYRFLPSLTAEDGPPALLLFNNNNPKIMSLLEESPAVNLYTYESKDQMLYYLSNGEQPELGLVIEDGFDQKINSNEPLILNGFMLHFFSDEQEDDLKAYMQEELEYLTGRQVNIEIERIQLEPDTYGITILASMGFGFLIIMIGMQCKSNIIM